MNFVDDASKIVVRLTVDQCQVLLEEVRQYSLRGQLSPATFEKLISYQWAVVGWRDRLSEMESQAKANLTFYERLEAAAKVRYETKLHAQIRLNPLVKEQKNQKAQLAEAEKLLEPEIADLQAAEEATALAEIYQKQVYNRLQEMTALAKDLSDIGTNMARGRSLAGGAGFQDFTHKR